MIASIVAQRLDALIRARLSERRHAIGLSEEVLGEQVFGAAGIKDLQKKINNLLRGQTKMSLPEFYMLCAGLNLNADRVFAAALDEVMQSLEKEDRAAVGKKDEPRQPGSGELSGFAPDKAEAQESTQKRD